MNAKSSPILLVDDESRTLLSFSCMLKSAGFEKVYTLEDPTRVLDFLSANNMAVIVLDNYMPNLSGTELLPKITEQYPDTQVVFMTAGNEVETAVDCIRIGAFDYLVKPVEKNRFLSSINKAIEFRGLRSEVSTLKKYLLTDKLENEGAFQSVVTVSRKMKSIFQYVEAISSSDQPVVITGETGVGKDLIAGAIHKLSSRTGEFVSVNIAGLDDMVFSDTLFGHVKGAYTGADGSRDGLIAKAQKGTIFLDEIGDLDESSQVKLLRLLQEKNYYPMGSDLLKNTDARVVVATNKDMHLLQKEGKMRKDLYFRLRTHHIHIPPLRERQEDIPLLLSHFLSEAAKMMGKKVPTPPNELIDLLVAYSFPGNVREFKSMIYDAVARHTSKIMSMASFKEIIHLENSSPQNDSVESPALVNVSGSSPHFPTLKEAESFLIDEAMKRANDNQGVAASLLGLTRQALNKRLIRNTKKNR